MLLFWKNMHVAHISLCKQRRRSTVNVVLTFPVPGDGCHNVEGSQLKKGEAEEHKKNQRGQKQMRPRCYAAWRMKQEPNIMSELLSAKTLHLLLLLSLQLFVNSWTEWASPIKASAAQPVLHCSTSFCRHARDSHSHWEKRGRRMWWGIQTQEEKRCWRAKDNGLLKGVWQRWMSNITGGGAGVTEVENTDTFLCLWTKIEINQNQKTGSEYLFKQMWRYPFTGFSLASHVPHNATQQDPAATKELVVVGDEGMKLEAVSLPFCLKHCGRNCFVCCTQTLNVWPLDLIMSYLVSQEGAASKT